MRITESQLRRIIRQEVRALREGAAAPLPTRDRNRVLSSFAYGQLRNYHGAELEQFESEAPDAYEAFLAQLWDLADPASGAGLDGRGFVPQLKAAMRAAGVGGSRRRAAPAGRTRPRGGSKISAAQIIQRLDGGESPERLELELYNTVAKPHDDHIIANDVQGTSRMAVGDLASPGEKKVLELIAKLPDPDHQDALLGAMADRTGEDAEELRDLMDYLSGA